MAVVSQKRRYDFVSPPHCSGWNLKDEADSVLQADVVGLWDFKSHEEYVSKFGNLENINTGRILKPRLNARWAPHSMNYLVNIIACLIKRGRSNLWTNID